MINSRPGGIIKSAQFNAVCILSNPFYIGRPLKLAIEMKYKSNLQWQYYRACPVQLEKWLMFV